MNTVQKFIAGGIKNTIEFIKANKLKSGIASALLLVVAVLVVNSFNEPEAVDQIVSNPTVLVKKVGDMASGRLFTAVGTVVAVSEARLQTESGGQVTGVFAEIGDTVKAGTILVTLENSSERASLLQAEGAYEAAQASAAQSNIGTREAEIRLDDAKDDLSRVSNSTYGVVQDVLINTVDVFYANQNTPNPSLRITTALNTDFLSSERRELNTTLLKWSSYEFTNNSDAELYKHVEFAKKEISRVLNLVDVFRTAVNDTKNDSRYTDTEKENLNNDLVSARAQLVAALNSIDGAKSSLMSAVEGLERAKISSTGGVTSAASAQLKQALGSYRAAQANFEKTVVRTPITGVVNALYLKAGEYASPSSPAGIVANNNGLELTTSVNQDDVLKLAVGDVVSIDKSATGTISAIAGAIDPTTGKVAVKISIDEASGVRNGTTVSVGFSAETEQNNTEITIPLSSVKMTGSGPVVFSVNEQSELVSVPVVLGPVSGNDVLINEGISLDSQIVFDARGLKAGQVVTVSSN